MTRTPDPSPHADDLLALTAITAELHHRIHADERHRLARMHLTTAVYHLESAANILTQNAAPLAKPTVDTPTP